MAKDNRIKRLCFILVAAVLVLALLLVLAMCNQSGSEEGDGDGTRQSWADYFLGNLQSPGDFEFDTFDWGDETEITTDLADGEGTIEGVVGMDGNLGNSDAAMAEDTPVLNLYSQIQDRVYLKMQSFGNYTGQGFDPASEYEPLEDGVSADFLPAYVMRETVKAEIYRLDIEPLLQVSVLPYYAEVRYGDGTYSDILVEGNATGMHTVEYRHWTTPERIKVSSWIRDYEKQYGHFVRNQYLTLDEKTEAYMKMLSEREGFDPNDPDIIQKVANYISNAATYNLNYDPALDGESNVAIAFLEQYKEGVCRHYAAAATLLYRYLGIPARYTVGFAAEVIPDTVNTVTAAQAHAWVEVYITGMGWQCVEVTGGLPGGGGGGGSGGGGGGGGGGNGGGGGDGDLTPIVLSPSFNGKRYDGTPLHHDQTILGFEEYERMGYTYLATVAYNPVVLGKETTSIQSVTLYDPLGNDVTDEFYIDLLQNYMQVYYEEITFKSVSKSKVYDGIPLSLTDQTGKDGERYADVSLYTGVLPADLTWDMTPLGDRTGVGTSDASFAVRLWGITPEGYYGDVTDCYYIRYLYGSLEVTPASITLEAASAEKTYDGTPLSMPAFSFVGGMLAKGHTVAECVVEGERTMVGRSGNIITRVVIHNENGEDVTANYAIETRDGVLRVKP